MRSTEALCELLRYLKAEGYEFTAVTPATHARILARPRSGPVALRDIFGWNRPFEERDVEPELIARLAAADALEDVQGKLRSKLRVASLGGELLLHGAFPTDDLNSVFFGPDTYRFARFLKQQLPRLGRAEWLVDMGAGSGAGAIAAARLHQVARVTMVDTNAAALELAAANARAAGLQAETLLSDAVPDGVDLIIANPPYMIDEAHRSYRDGGGLLGGAVAVDWARQALDRLVPGGTMLLYTGAAFVDGEAPLVAELASACAEDGAELGLSEIDPDVFGEELEQPAYQRVERIAAIGAVIRTRRA